VEDIGFSTHKLSNQPQSSSISDDEDALKKGSGEFAAKGAPSRLPPKM